MKKSIISALLIFCSYANAVPDPTDMMRGNMPRAVFQEAMVDVQEIAKCDAVTAWKAARNKDLGLSDSIDGNLNLMNRFRSSEIQINDNAMSFLINAYTHSYAKFHTILWSHNRMGLNEEAEGLSLVLESFCKKEKLF